MSEFKLQSPSGHRVHLYVNPYTHDYEITDIPTKYQVQHIGHYVGSFFSYYPLSRRDVFHCTSYKIMDQSTLDKRYEEDGKRTNICFTCNKAGHWARNCPDKEKQRWTTVFVYVNPYTHELKILPTWRLGHQFQNMRYVGVLKSICNECKIKSAQNTISVESQTEQSKKKKKNSMQNDCENTEKHSIQNHNTCISNSEICQLAEQLEKLADRLYIPKSDSRRSFFKPEKKKKKINSHQQKDLSSSEEKQQDRKDSPQNTISVESQTEQSEKNSIQNDCKNTEKKNSIQNNNTSDTHSETFKFIESDSDSEICQTAERLERLANSLNIPKLDHCRSRFKPQKKNQINSHQQKDLSSGEEKQQDKKQQDSKDKKKKRSAIFVNQKSMKIKPVQIY